jgi:hypothetical protein
MNNKAIVIVRACLLALVVSVSCVAFAQQASTEPSPEEYRVLAAAIDGFRSARLASHPIVADHTSTFACSSGCNGFATGGCNGLRGKDETPSDRLAIVKRDLPQLEQTTISDFKLKNEQCSEIAKRIPTGSPYILFGVSNEKLPSGWEHPDFFYFSRVGFNPQRTQALVHISFMSGTNATTSGGKYFLLLKQNGKWDLKGSSAVWELVSR